MRTLLNTTLLLAALLGVGLLAGCGNGSSQQAEHIDVRDFRYVEQPNGQREFVGEVHNSGDRDVSVTQVEVTLFDEGGAQVGTQYIEVNDIPANDMRAFTHPLEHSGSVGQARISSVMTP